MKDVGSHFTLGLGWSLVIHVAVLCKQFVYHFHVRPIWETIVPVICGPLLIVGLLILLAHTNVLMLKLLDLLFQVRWKKVGLCDCSGPEFGRRLF